MKIHMWTQDIENYGSADEPYWKTKGGEDFFVPLTDVSLTVEEAVQKATAQIECNDEMFTRYVAGYNVVEDDYLTEFERSQLEYDGTIVYPSKIIALA
jgi:hypothetical protein